MMRIGVPRTEIKYNKISTDSVKYEEEANRSPPAIFTQRVRLLPRSEV